jgi:large subunit ribosomal protein L31
MKTGVHPTYHQEIPAKCSCGAEFTVGSTAESISTELCSQCHPFYTGKQKLVDTAGKVDKFRAKLEAAKAGAGKKKDISESVRAAAAAKAGKDNSALGSKKMVGAVKASRVKAELELAKAEEAKTKAKEEAKKPVETKAEESPAEEPKAEEAKTEEQAAE